MESGVEWVIEAHGCEPATLRDVPRLQTLFAELTAAMELHPLGSGNWHQFPGAGGVTGLQLLQESHVACHTFPEFASLCLNVFCCRPRASTDFETLLTREFGAARVFVRRIERPFKP